MIQQFLSVIFIYIRSYVKIQYITLRMDLTKYKMIRTKNFPISKKPSVTKSPNRPDSITTIALISENDSQSYQIHLDDNNIIIFNEHEYLKRQFSHAFKLQTQEVNEECFKMINNIIETVTQQNQNNLIIFNSLDLGPVENIIFDWKAFTQYRSDSDQIPEDVPPPASAIKTILDSIINTKRSKSVVSLSILGIRSDGSLQDQLNYEWIEQSKYVQDLMKIKQKSKLKVKKYKTQIKAFDLNRQHIREWIQAEQILYHYSQIKQYIQSWKQQLNPSTIPKIGQIYQISELEIDEQLGTIINVYKRKCLVKLNQFMSQSNLVSMKLTQLLKQKIGNVQSICTRDFPVLMFLKDYFDKSKKSQYTILTQLGTNQSLKQQAICLTMDLQIPGTYVYLKNYCDKPQIIQQVKSKAVTFIPMTSNERVSIKVGTANPRNKLKKKSLNIIKQGEQIASKSFYFDTFSWNEKKKGTYNQAYNIQNQLDEKKDEIKHIYGSYSKPASLQRNNNAVDKK